MPRRKPRPEEHENLERWLVSYADFITLLFAFFVVMYAISSVNEGKYRVLSDSLLAAFTDTPPIKFGNEAARALAAGTPVERAASAAEAKQRVQQEKMKKIAKNVLEVLQPLMRDGQVKVTQTNKGIAVEINASVLFQPADANLNPESLKALRAVAEVLAEIDNPIRVEGYTDNIPIRTAFYPSNWELSAARAGSVVRLFTEHGVMSDRLVAVGYADNKPVAENASEEGRSRNRRVTIMILAEGEEKRAEMDVRSESESGTGWPPSSKQ
jgi:chemotaxis protein MotB